MSFESIVELVDKNKTRLSSNDYLKIMNSLKKIYDSTIKVEKDSKKEFIIVEEESEEEEDMRYVNYTNNEDDDTYASLWK